MCVFLKILLKILILFRPVIVKMQSFLEMLKLILFRVHLVFKLVQLFEGKSKTFIFLDLIHKIMKFLVEIYDQMNGMDLDFCY